MVRIEPEPFIIGNGSEALEVMDRIADWLIAEGFGEDSPDLAHQLYTKCKLVFGEGQYRINGSDLERFGSGWGVVVASNEIEQFLSEVE